MFSRKIQGGEYNGKYEIPFICSTDIVFSFGYGSGGLALRINYYYYCYSKNVRIMAQYGYIYYIGRQPNYYYLRRNDTNEIYVTNELGCGQSQDFECNSSR